MLGIANRFPERNGGVLVSVDEMGVERALVGAAVRGIASARHPTKVAQLK